MKDPEKEKALKKAQTERNRNPYNMTEIISKTPVTQIPLVLQGGAYANGPELRDPRLNLEYNMFIKHKVDGEKFWVKYISGNNNYLLEVRWDLFEDALLAYLQ